MKKGLKWKLISLLAIFSSLFVLAGCKFNFTLDETLDDKKLGATVTYHTNAAGASFGNSVDGSTQVMLGFPTGSYAMNIGVDEVKNGTVQTPSLNGYVLDGWYFAAVDGDGNVRLDDKGYVILGEEVDFSQTLQKGDRWNVYAKWKRLAFIEVVLVGEIEDGTTFDATVDKQNVTYAVGDVIKTYDFVNGERAKLSSPVNEKQKDYTFLHYYADENCTQEVNWPIKEDETATHRIYAKYIKGDWTVVRTAKNLQDYFASGAVSALTGAATNAYLFDEDGDNVIDCTGFALKPIANFGGTFAGNGVTLKNISVDVGTVTGNTKAALFGNVKDTAKIENVTFENVSMSVSLMPNAGLRIFFLFTELANVAAVQNVTLKGEYTMTVSRPDNALVINMIRDNTWHEEYLFFGNGDSDSTDSAQIDGGLGVDMTDVNVTVTIDNKTIAMGS